jgi:Arc-like DNA binding domain
MARKLTDTVHLRLRFGEKLRRRLEREAARNQHSMNSEIIERLERSFLQQDQQVLMEQAATTALSKAGFPVIPIGATAPNETQTAGKTGNPSEKDKAP